ncbi:MAG TPA: acyl-CoA dehydrogenase family protein, partial [Candidatus Binataceae bacterium]|nr:acyl-CoA dehydrogenase family protein [Candidatus Binataceae bacterium]
IPAELITQSWDLGLVCGPIPETYGGYGDQRSAVTGAIIAEELAYGDLAIALHMLAPRLTAFPVLESGTDAQREAILKPLCAGHFVAGSAALMEPRYDYDASALTTVAERNGSGFILNGTKCFVPLAGESASILVFASDMQPGFEHVDGFIVDRRNPGLTISAPEKNMGIKALQTYELKLEQCRVESTARLGGESGIKFPRLLSESRVALAAMAVGVARAAFEYARDYAKERRAFGAPIATKQAIAFMLAEMAIEIDASRLLVWEAAWHLDRGEDALKESYQARNYAAQACLTIADNAVQVLGGHGYIREHPVELWLRNARGFAIFDGLATI